MRDDERKPSISCLSATCPTFRYYANSFVGLINGIAPTKRVFFIGSCFSWILLNIDPIDWNYYPLSLFFIKSIDFNNPSIISFIQRIYIISIYFFLYLNSIAFFVFWHAAVPFLHDQSVLKSMVPIRNLLKTEHWESACSFMHLGLYSETPNTNLTPG